MAKEMKYELETIAELPVRTRKSYTKPSKYDPIIDAYLASKRGNQQVKGTGKKAQYLVTQLNKRMEAREITGTQATAVNDAVFLIPTPEPED